MTLAALPCNPFILLACFWILTSTATAATADQPTASTAAGPTIASAQIGFGGVYKLGCWTPIVVELQGGSQAWTGQVEVVAPDTDGVPTRVVSAAEIEPNATNSVRMFVRVGQASSAIEIALRSAEGKQQAKRSFYLGAHRTQGTLGGFPATNRVVLEFGPSLDLNELIQSDAFTDLKLATRIAHLEQADELPTQWYGYESVETVLLSTSKPELYLPLSQDPRRLEALRGWVESGGQLILFCASGAEKLLVDEGVLADFAPGRFEKMERLAQPEPIATFSGSSQPITRNRRIDLSVPSLLDVRGKILASAGRSETNVPLVVRTRRGLGEVVFVGLDFDRPPLSEWAGRTSFIRRVLDWQAFDKNKQTVEQQDWEDLSSHLRNSLDKKFEGVQVIPFALVAFLAGVYILLIGPGDFLFVKRILNRPELTWVTFPLIVLGVSVTAYLIANRMKGNQLRVNQVEIVDVDCTGKDPTSCPVRGTLWTHFFVPEVSDLDLQLHSDFLGQSKLDSNEKLVSWLGLPGHALGGMQANGAQTSVFASGYEYGESLASMRRLPVQVWSTKTLTARWSAQVKSTIHAELQQDGEELLGGTITNNSKAELTDCAILYGRWAYNLGRLPAGKSIEIDDSLQPRTVKTLLTNSTAGDESVTNTAADGTVPFSRAEWDLARLLKVMMFYRAVNGPQYTGMVHRYQSFVDLSNILQQDDQAILVARRSTGGSHWESAKGPLTSDEDRNWTYYRFVLPVSEQETSDRPSREFTGN